MVARQAEIATTITKPFADDEKPERQRGLAFIAQSLRTELLRTREMVARRDEQISLLTASFASLKHEAALQKEELQKRTRTVVDQSAKKEQVLGKFIVRWLYPNETEKISF